MHTRSKLAETIYLTLPWILWPIAFLILRDEFIQGMVVATGIIGVYTLITYDVRDLFTLDSKTLSLSLAYTVILYGLFWAGNKLVTAIGLGHRVIQVYEMIGRNTLLALPLA